MCGIWGLLILSLAQAAPKEHSARPNPASIAYECAFDSACDLNFDRWPDGWKRQFGIDHPRYIQVEIGPVASKRPGDAMRLIDVDSHTMPRSPLAAISAEDSDEDGPQGDALVVRLNGGNVTVYSPDIEANSTFSYSFEAYVHAESLRHSRVEVSLLFLNDETPPRVLERQTAPVVFRTSGWKKVQIEKTSPNHPETRLARIELAIRSDLRHDLSGVVAFDNVRFIRLPRISFSLDRRFHVFPTPEDVELTCHVSGVDRANPEIQLELFDVMGMPVKPATLLQAPTRAIPVLARPSAISEEGASPASSPENAASYVGQVRWKPEPPGYGFYRARATYIDSKGEPKTSETSFVVTEPATNRKVGDFGWSLTTRPPVALRDLATLLSDVGVNWLKYPAWYAASQQEELIDFSKFADRLGTQGITVVGVLDRAPEELERDLGVQLGDGAAGILGEKKLWGPAFDAQMARLSLMVRHWQLGKDGDESFYSIDRLEEKVAELRRHLEGYGQNTKLTLSWNWLYAPPPAPVDRIVWDAVSFYSPQPPTSDELAFLLSHSSLERTRPWVVIKPLDQDRYSVEVRARDLVQQMITAKMQGAPVVFIHDPIGPKGLIGADGVPGDMLLPWRTAANYFTNAEFRGSLPLLGRSRNYLFTRDHETNLVLWNDYVAPGEPPVMERVYLGRKVKIVDLWGRTTPLATRIDENGCAYQEIPVGPLPVFITGVDRGAAMWDLTFRFDNEALATQYGAEEINGVTFENHFESAIKGTIEFLFPKTWKVDQRTIQVALAPGDPPRHEPLRVGLLDSASSGEEIAPMIIELQNEELHRFKIFRRLRIGVTDVELEALAQVQPTGDLLVELQIDNKTEQTLSFKATLSPEERRSIRRLVLDAKPGRTHLRFLLSDAASLADKQILIRVVEIDSDTPRVINKSIRGPS